MRKVNDRLNWGSETQSKKYENERCFPAEDQSTVAAHWSRIVDRCEGSSGKTSLLSSPPFTSVRKTCSVIKFFSGWSSDTEIDAKMKSQYFVTKTHELD